MPRRRIGGAAAAFLLVILVAPSSGATDERIVPDQDISDLSREEQIAYLILNDQLSDIHRWYQRRSEATGDDVLSPEFACVRVGWNGESIDPSPSLLELLNRAEMARGEAIGVAPASACNGDGATPLLEVQSGRPATLVETDVFSSDQAASERRKRCPGSGYAGGWGGSACFGLCGVGDEYYDIGEDADSIWLLRSACHQND